MTPNLPALTTLWSVNDLLPDEMHRKWVKGKNVKNLQGNTTGFMWSVVTINTDRDKQIAPDYAYKTQDLSIY